MLPLVVLVSIRELMKTDVYVDNNKGYALRRLGMYSSNVIEQIIHSIIPLNDLCATDPNTDICSYSAQLRQTKIFELATVLSSRDVVQTFSYDKDYVSRSTGNDIIRVFSQHQPNTFFNNENDMIHFTNNKFFKKDRNEQSIHATSDNNVIDNFSDIPRIRSRPTQQIIHRINNQKIDLEYFSPNALETFATAISSTLNPFNTFSNVQEMINLFSELIIGQSIYGLPYCSLSQEKSHHSQPCLVVSTFFLNVPVDHRSTFPVYWLIPLPIVVDHKKYIYSNFPQIVAVNPIDNTLLTWEEEANIKKCMFSTFISCHPKPISVSLSKSSCLGQLLDEHQANTSLCDVNQSDNIQDDVLSISDGLWLFYNVQQATTCQLYSNLNTLPELITIKKPGLVSVPCEKTMTCADFQIPTISCKKGYIVKTPTFDFNVKNSSRSVISITNMTNTILAAYRSKFNKSVNELKTIFKTNESTIYQKIADLAVYIITFISFVFIVAFLRCLAIMKYNLEREMKTLLFQLRKLLSLDENPVDSFIDDKP